MSNTSNLVLPYLTVGQAQKHVTVNESLRKLDAVIQLAVVSATTTAEPGSPADGAVWIVPAGKTGATWSGFANGSLAYYRDGAWVELTPREGWLAFVKDTDQLLAWTGSAWSLFTAAKILTVSATDKVLGRSTSGAGAAEEIAFTSQARQLADDTSFGAMRTTLGAAGLADANVFTAVQKVSASSQVDNTGMHQLENTTSNANASLICKTDKGAAQFMKWENYGLRLGMRSTAGGGAGDIIFTVGADSAVWRMTSGELRPEGDNAVALGHASYRTSVVYSATGTINTSDAREKTPLRSLSEAETRAIRRVFAGVGVYQWLDAIGGKGADARLHVGVTAQAVRDAFEVEGLDATRYGLFCADPLVEQVEIAETRRVTRQAMQSESERVVEIVDGKPVARIEQRDAPAFELKPLVDETGAPVIEAGRALLHPVPVLEEIDETVTRLETRVALDEKGAPVIRLGVRYDQLFAMALAALMGG